MVLKDSVFVGEVNCMGVGFGEGFAVVYIFLLGVRGQEGNRRTKQRSCERGTVSWV